MRRNALKIIFKNNLLESIDIELDIGDTELNTWGRIIGRSVLWLMKKERK